MCHIDELTSAVRVWPACCADVPASERQALFIQKLQLCSIRMPFNKEPPDDMRNKEIKRLNLLEIMDYINNTKNVFNEQTFYEITSMVRPSQRHARTRPGWAHFHERAQRRSPLTAAPPSCSSTHPRDAAAC